MTPERVQKIKEIIKVKGPFGKYDLGGVRAGILRIRKYQDQTPEMMILLDEVDNIIRNKVVPYIKTSFVDKGPSNCGTFQKKLIDTTKKGPNGNVESLLVSIKNGVDTPIMYHVTFRYHKSGKAGHFFTLLLRPNRRPYIVQEEINSYNLYQYILYNILRGIKNPLSKEPAKICIFLKEAKENKSVPLDIFTYLFGYVWDQSDNKVPIEYINVEGTTVPNNIYDFGSMSIS